MNLICDLLLIAIVVLCAWIGKRRGFIKTFFGLVGSLLSWGLTALFFRPVGNFLSREFFSPALHRHFLHLLEQKAGSGEEHLEFSALPESCNEVLERYGVSAERIRDFAAEHAESGEQLAEKVADFVVDPIAGAIGNAVAFLVLFIVFTIAVRVLVKALDLISRLPILNFSNRFLGLAVGAVWGLVLAVLLSSLLALLEPGMRGSDYAFLQSFDLSRTFLVRFFNQIHIFR